MFVSRYFMCQIFKNLKVLSIYYLFQIVTYEKYLKG